jgi:hypothetical protein
MLKTITAMWWFFCLDEEGREVYPDKAKPISGSPSAGSYVKNHHNNVVVFFV